MAANTSKDITDTIVSLVSENVEYEGEVTPETRFIADLNLDSLQVMELVANLEDTFEVIIPIEHLTTVQNIADVAALVERLSREEGQ